MAQEIARQPRVFVAFVVDPGQPAGLRIGVDFGARRAEQRAQQAQAVTVTFVAHAGGTGNAATAQQVEEDGLGLVATMLGQQQRAAGPGTIGKSRVAGGAGGGFQSLAGAAVDDHRNDGQRHGQARAGSAAEIGPVIGARRQAMVDVDCREPAGQRQTAQQIEQDDGIAPAGETEMDSRAGSDAGGGESADPLEKVSRQAVP